MIVPATGLAIYFGITVTEIESVVEPDGVAGDRWRESVALVGVHEPILPTKAS